MDFEGCRDQFCILGFRLSGCCAALVRYTQGSAILGRGANRSNYLLMSAAMLATLLLALIVVTPFWVVLKKAGFYPLLSVVVLIPLVNPTMLYAVAFSKWKTIPAQQF